MTESTPGNAISRRQVLKSSVATALAVGSLPTTAGPAAASGGEPDAAPAAVGPRSIRLTWMSIANWLLEVGDTAVLLDGYISRVPGPPFFFGGGGGLARTQAPVTPDVAVVRRVFDAVSGRRIDHVLTSHSHFDHSFDTAVWARLTGAPVVGSRTTAFQAIAQGIPVARCQVVEGGEVLRLGRGLTCRVIRTNHGGDRSNPEQHDPVELAAVPRPDRVFTRKPAAAGPGWVPPLRGAPYRLAGRSVRWWSG